MRYQDWADRNIIEHADECPLAARLCCQENARFLWEILRRHPGFKLRKPTIMKSPEHSYYWSCKVILNELGKLPSITPGEYKKKSQKVAILARKLAKELSFEADTIGALGKVNTPSLLKKNSLIEEILNSGKHAIFSSSNRFFIINTVSERDYLTSFNDCSPFEVIENAKDVLRKHRQKEAETNEINFEAWNSRWGITDEHYLDDAFLPSKEARDDYPEEIHLPINNEVLAAQILVNLSKLTITGLLHKLANEMDNYQSAEFYVKRPDSDGLAKQVFARKLHEYHMNKFGQPLWDALAIATTISLNLDEPLSADDIRPIISGGRK